MELNHSETAMSSSSLSLFIMIIVGYRFTTMYECVIKCPINMSAPDIECVNTSSSSVGL